MGDVQSPSVVCFDPKKGEENFARLCQFLMTICGDILRVVLSHHIKPGDLRSQLDLNQSRLDRITNAQEKDLLFPPNSSTTCCPPIRSKDLDLSLLYKILRNICNIPKHRAGWGNPPGSGDYTLSACIERIRLLRNSISGHSTNGTIDDTQFEDYWQELKTSVVEIEKDVIGSDKYERGIDHLHDCDLNPTKAREYVAQIRRIRGEVAIKRERIHMVENTCIEIGEEIDAKKARLDKIEKSVSDMKDVKDEILRELKSSEIRVHQKISVLLESAKQNQRAILTVAKAEILREMKSSETRVQQKISESENTNSDRTPVAKIEGIEVSTTIKFKDVLSCTSMSPTVDNKCWLLVKPISLFLLNDSKVIKKVDIPGQYCRDLLYSNITTNDRGDAVFISGRLMIAVTQDGTVYKLFDVSFLYISPKLCFLHYGKYIIIDRGISTFESVSIHEYSDYVVCTVTTDMNAYNFVCNIRQNHNGDIVITGSNGIPDDKCFLMHVLDPDDFRTKHRVPLPEPGVVVPCMNSRSDLLYGHGKNIDLLTRGGQMVKTVYITNRDREIENIASSADGTVWILYSSHEVEIIKMEF